MSLIDERYIFRLANTADIDAIMAFYRREWGVNHLLATDRSYFRYQHEVGDNVNFMLAIHRESGEIHAAEGFIQYSQDLCDIGAVMWKIGSRCRTPMLGVEVVRRLKQATGCRVYLGPGANPKTAVPLHRQALKHLVGRLDHYYMLGDGERFRVAHIAHRPAVTIDHVETDVALSPLHAFDEIEDQFDFARWYERKPFKDGWYVRRRYFNNPIYRYRVFALTPPGAGMQALMVTREIAVNGARVLRIVDVIGDADLLSGIGAELRTLLIREEFEYVDLYCKGVDQAGLEAAGFTCKSVLDTNVIPNYFEPFVQANVDIWYSLSDGDTLLFKADGDQDRPNARPLLQQADTGAARTDTRAVAGTNG